MNPRVDPLGETLASDRGRPPLADISSIDRFEIEGELGVGGMGRVYRAHDPRLKRTVALKLVEGDEDLVREAQAMAQVSHANVVTVYDAGVVDGRVWIAMEYVEGGTWRARIASSPGWRDVVVQLLHAGRGLAAAHAAGIVHRDFKPENILVGRDGKTRVSDFGLAHAAVTTSAGELVTTVAGTPAYMSPEQHLGRRGDERSDQFSFCVTMWESVHGGRPFANDTDVRVVAARVIAGKLEKRTRRIPRWLDRAIRRGLSVDPQDRWPSMDALLDALDRGLRRRMALVAVAALVVVAAGVMLWWARAREEHRASSPWREQLIGRESEGNPTESMPVSPDGKLAAFTWGDKIWIQDLETGVRRAVTLPRKLQISTLRFAPDSRGLYFMGGDAERDAGDLMFVGIDGQNLRRIAEIEDGARPFTVSPDGSKLVLSSFSSFGSTPAGIDVIDGRTGERTTVVERKQGRILSSATMSPDGHRIAYLRDSMVFVVDVESRKSRVVGGSPLEYLLYRPVRGIEEIAWIAPTTWVVNRDYPGPGGSGSGWRAVLERWEIDDDLNILATFPFVEPAQYGTMTSLGAYDRIASFTTHSSERHTIVYDLTGPLGGKPSLVDIGSLSDDFMVGWTPRGGMVFAANLGGGFDTFEVLDGVATPVLSPVTSDRPVAVIDDAIWVNVGMRCDVKKVTSRGVEPITTQCLVPICAGHRARPCLVYEEARQTRTYRWWDPDTGKAGDTVLTIPWIPSNADEALSPDGRSLAVGRLRKGVEIFDLATGSSRSIGNAENAMYQSVTYGPDGTLYANRIASSQELVRFNGDTPEVLIAERKMWLYSPRVSHDGKRIAVTQTDQNKRFWVARPTESP